MLGLALPLRSGYPLYTLNLDSNEFIVFWYQVIHQALLSCTCTKFSKFRMYYQVLNLVDLNFRQMLNLEILATAVVLNFVRDGPITLQSLIAGTRLVKFKFSMAVRGLNLVRVPATMLQI
eukprot:SAG31_NODE_7631_length_1635_cov_0.854818_1_plen_120_part_00